jgi:glutamate synthase domain-containing protein 2/glutamate synthase domain-containing protein 1/glutamate synthase domain-containing protein 3
MDDDTQTKRGRHAAGLYDPAYERDACGVAFVADMAGRKSARMVALGLEALRNLQHRGATGADRDTGDGAGILLQTPDRFLRKVCASLKRALPAPGAYGVGMFFLPQDEDARRRCRAVLDQVAAEEGFQVLGWRAVAVCPVALGEQARTEQPSIEQAFYARSGMTDDDLEWRLYVLRRRMEKAVAACAGAQEFHACSLSARTLVYKGLMTADQMPAFFADLGDPDMESALAVVHQRYSTNTFPSWRLAQPLRYLAHNGEINTLPGNLNNMRAREPGLICERLGLDLHKVLPVVQAGGSDSACLDNVLELLLAGGRSLPHALAMLIPKAWGSKYPMGPDLRGFFEYHAGIMEPWDGPAAIAFSDGRCVGALLDRNGLRPARYTVTDDGFIVLASEAGVLDIEPARVAEKGALRPGQMILADLVSGRLLKDAEIMVRLARRRPYRRWVAENKIEVHGFFNAVSAVKPDSASLRRRQLLFGYTREDLDLILAPMAAKAHEPIGSMGSDQPLAVFSEKAPLLYDYFKQLFAQVTNPAIDPIREELVMSLMTFLGNSDQMLAETPGHARLVKLRHPFLANEDLARIRALKHPDFQTRTLSMSFPARGAGRALETALDSLCRQAEAAARDGQVRILILSDRDLPETRAPIPALLAVSAVNRRLIQRGLRTRTGLIVETGEAREVAHMAALLAYGASAINPCLAFETIADLALDHALPEPLPVVACIQNYLDALCKGLLKVMSKMGISTLRSYRRAQVFEAVGLGAEIVERYFEGTASRVGGIGLEEIAAEINVRVEAAAAVRGAAVPLLPSGGRYRYRTDGERHLWTPESLTLLQRAVRENREDFYRQYAALIADQSRRQSVLRGLLTWQEREAVPLDEVESAESLVRRFVTGAMSFGSISREAHETLALAMNGMGGMSNSGEGGEDAVRYRVEANGDSRCSAIKQVASGRFGVTTEYLVNARDLQIKIAQGAKPGEGGQLPGHKVDAEIARVRHSTPGVTLVSPPPHHDIYSIEDIAELIFDLKCVNPDARVSVKLVSEAGVGAVAAGVAKAKADVILISGYDGGTGASPLSSISHAGAPWELGLAETQQTLVRNGLRTRVRLQVDGQLKTGRDVVVGALLGAEEFGFATAPLVACGCVMMRKCHDNACPVGIATQNPELRKRFAGRPEHVRHFMFFVAREVREIMARLGFRTMDEMIGRCDVLKVQSDVAFAKARTLDFSRILTPPAAADVARQTRPQEHAVADTLDARLLKKIGPAVERGEAVEVALPIRNTDRAVGAMIAGRLVRRHGGAGLPPDTVRLRFRGSAGQSFGAFGARGMTLLLEGEANDYLGKGLSGAVLAVRPSRGARMTPQDNAIAGNVLLYGATSGEVYLNGRAGERFAVRNSGARAVVEGLGDHGCEYMTGGRVAILGSTGVNFGAGMSGGIAYVYDPDGRFDACCNLDTIDLEPVDDPADREELHAMLVRHRELTGSPVAADILENWPRRCSLFVKVFPMEYRRALGAMMREDECTEREEPVMA